MAVTGVTTYEDLKVIKAIIDTDPYIAEYLQFSAKDVRVRKVTNDLIETGSKMIAIYPLTPITRGGGFTVTQHYAIDVTVSENLYVTALKACDQIVALLNNRDIGHHHQLELRNSPVEMSAPDGVVQYTLSFSCQSTVYKAIQSPPVEEPPVETP